VGAAAAPPLALPQLVLPQFFLLVSFSKNLSGMAQSTKQANILQQSPPEAFQAKASPSNPRTKLSAAGSNQR